MNIYQGALNKSNIYDVDAINPNRQDRKKPIQGNSGDVLSAVIVDITSEKTTLMTKNNESFSVPPDSVKGEKGEEVFFEVLDNGKDATRLKQVFRDSSSFKKAVVKNVNARDLKDLMAKADFIASDEELEQPQSDEAKAQQAAARIKRQLSYIVNNSNSAAIAELAACGVSIDKISLDMLMAVSKEIKSNPLIRTRLETTGGYTGVKRAENKQTESKQAESGQGGVSRKNIVEALDRNEMPASGKNVAAAEGALEKLESIKDLSGAAIAAVLKSGKPLTIDNLYVAKFSAAGAVKNEMPREIFADLMPEVRKVFDREDIQPSKENIAAAKLLIENDVDLTRENIENVKFLKNLSNEIDVEGIVNAVIENIKDDAPAGGTSVFVENEAVPKELIVKYESLIQDMPKIARLDMTGFVNRDMPVTLGQLQRALNGSEGTDINAAAEENAIALKRQVIEISLKLTYESAARLIDKRISIDTMPLEKALDALKREEQELNAGNLRIFGTATEAGVDKLTALYSEIQSFPFASASVYGGFMDGSAFFSIREISKAETVQPQDNTLRVLRRYDEINSTPNAKYGDSYRKAEGQLASVLEALGLDATEQSVRAARILSRNNIDITEENLLNVKLIDSKVERIYSTLHPMIAAKMVSDGLDPSEMHIDDVIAYIDSFGGEYGDVSGGKLAKYVMEMDRSKTVSEKNREAIISVYRMLNKILKDGGVSVGAALGAEKNLTLGNLLEMSKVAGKGGVRKNIINRSVDDSFALPYDEGLRFEHNKALIDRFVNEATPTAFDNVINEHYTDSDFMDSPIERLIVELEEMKARLQGLQSKSEISRMIEQIRNVQDAPSNALRFMEANGIPLTIANIDTLKSMLKKPGLTQDLFNDITKESDEIAAIFDDAADNTSLDSLRQIGAEEAALNYAEAIEAAMLEGGIGSAEKIDALKRAVALNNAAHQRAFLSIPVKMNGKMTEINMYVINDDLENADEVNMLLLLRTELGNLEIGVNAISGRASLTISSDNGNAVSLFSENRVLLEQLVEEAGFTVSGISFQTTEERNMLAEAVRGV